MKKLQVKVKEAKSQRKRESRATRALAATKARLRAALLRPRLVIVAGLVGFVAFIGTPHVGWDYRCAHQMTGIGTCRSAAWCAYYGVQGRRIDRPASGETCDLVKFMPPDLGMLWEMING